ILGAGRAASPLSRHRDHGQIGTAAAPTQSEANVGAGIPTRPRLAAQPARRPFAGVGAQRLELRPTCSSASFPIRMSLLRPEALQALRGSAMIIHAGDVGKPAVLEHLRGLAPVVAVRGNIDRQPWARSLPPSALLTANGHSILVLHEL